MPKLKVYNIFISHPWNDDGEYNNLVKLLTKSKQFKFTDLSIPEHDPLTESGSTQLRKSLESRIRRSQIVLIIMRLDYKQRSWVQQEIGMAKRHQKPIVAVLPRGTRHVLRDIEAEAVVAWNAKSIVKAIRKHSL